MIEEATPEERVPFDDIPGEPRNSDLVAVGTANGRGFALSIEAKADESFGDLVQDELSRASRKLALEIPTRMIMRIERLAEALLPGRIGGSPRLGELRYQLLTAAAGSIAYAKQRAQQRAVLIVHEFHSTAINNTKRADNQRDLDRFVERVSAGEWTRVADGRLLGPITVPGSEHVPGEVRLFIGKASRQLP